MDDKDLVGYAIALFDMVGGIKVCHRWIFCEQENINLKISEMFKITLSNVHRQSESFFANFLPSIIRVENYGLLMMNTTFLVQKSRNSYYSVGLIINDENRNMKKNNSRLNNMLINWISILGISVRKVIEKGEQFSVLNDVVDKVKEMCSNILRVGIPAHENLGFDLNDYDQQLLSVLLTSFFKTQMTVVIETSDENEGKKYLRFLSNFLLPYQKEMTSIEMSKDVIPDLYLQCIEEQTSKPLDLMVQFSRPITWFKVDKKQVLIFSTNKSKQECISYFELMNILYFGNSDQESKKKIVKYKSDRKAIEVNTSAQFINSFLSSLYQSSSYSYQRLCDNFLSSIVRLSVSFIAHVNEKLEFNKISSLTKEQLIEIFKSLGLNYNEYMEIALSVAQIFDTDIYNKAGKQIK